MHFGKRALSVLLALCLTLSLVPAALAAGEPAGASTEINSETVWKYLDDNTDPAGDPDAAGYNRTSWTLAGFDDSAWKTASGSFGAKNGGAYSGANVQLDGCPGTADNYPTYYFRATVTVADASAVTKIAGTISYDDAAILYINGVKAIAFNENGITGNSSYCNDKANTTEDFEITDAAVLAALADGENTVAVELHNQYDASSDVWFALTGMTFSTEEIDETEVPVTVEQTNISLSMGADESRMNFTWYCAVDGAVLTVADNPSLTGARTVEAASAAANDGLYSCKATVTGLEPSTTYYYQLSNSGTQSEIYSFTTGGSGAFSFAYVGDPQIGASKDVPSDTAGWENTLNIIAADSAFSDVSFLLSAGDQVETASNETQYDCYLDHDALLSLPAATAIGNHDSTSNAYSQHFNVANESAEYGVTAAGGDSYFVYNNVLFLVLNSNNTSAAEHKAFMEAAIEATAGQDIAWKVVAFHHSLYTVASHSGDSYITSETGFKNTMVPVLNELGVDVVLQGHDHVYCRTYIMDGFTPVIESDGYEYANGTDAAPTAVTDPDGILYVTANSGSGSKTYDIVTGDFPFSAVQNQEHIPNVSKVTVSDASFTITTYRTTDMTVVDSFTIYHTAEEEPAGPSYTPVETADTRVTGFYNDSGSLTLELAGRYNSGAMNADGGSLEIVAYNPANGFAYAVSGVKGKLIAVDLNGNLDGDTVVTLPGTEYDVKSLVDGFAYGDMTSVAVSPDGTKLAVAIQAENYADPGVAALFACSADGSLTLLSAVAVGVQPDMVTFADDSTILTADEGEPRDGVNGADPKGSVTIVTVGADNTLTADTVTFDSFDEQRDTLTAAGVLVQKGTNPSADFEPEYIAVSGGAAYVSLQEANAVAVLDIASGTFTGVYPLGFQDYSVTQVDLQKNDTVELSNYENVYGVKMPDGIAVATIGGKTYLLTANEGDSRADWDGLDNEDESKTSPTGNVTLDEKVVWFNATLWDGLDESKAYVFGGRSFSVYEVTDEGLNLVYDSGSGFEEVTAEQLPAYFNASNDKTSLDNRSGKKGPEPESVVTGVVDGRTYAFIALERIGGVMVYDVTDPANAEFVNYINSREFDSAVQGDVSPEGLCFVSASDSKTGAPLLLAACEVSGTLAVYELTAASEPIPAPLPDPVPAPAPGTGADTDTDTGTGADTGTAIRFTDVLPGAYYADAVVWAVESGVTNGTSAVTFSPDKVCTRAEAVAFLWRAWGAPEPSGAANPFTDVSADAYYAKAVLWAAEQGVTLGTSADTFSPDGTCTRAQIVTFLARAAHAKAASTANPFTDVADNAYYADAVLWAAEQGIALGTSAGAFSPDNACTRAEIVTFLYRCLAQ